MEGDHCQLYRILDICIFQSTPSAWRETYFKHCSNISSGFQSTPSAWRETRFNLVFFCICFNFNPLPPHGGRPVLRLPKSTRRRNFNPLPPHGGRPLPTLPYFGHLYISIHSLRMEGDQKYYNLHMVYNHFNPLPPHGGRPVKYLHILL